MLHQVGQQFELPLWQVQLHGAAADRLSQQIDGHVFDGQIGGRLPQITPQQRSDTSQQFVDRKSLDHVVVSDSPQPHNSVVDRIASRQRQHKSCLAFRAETAVPVEATAVRQHHVQNHQIDA